MAKKFYNPDGEFDPRVKFKHPFKRFVTILTQKR